MVQPIPDTASQSQARVRRATSVRILWLAATLLALPARAPADSLISLELPGIEGEAGPPAPAGSIALESFALGADSLTAIKALDASSPELLRATIEGILFATARLEVFDTEVVPTKPIETYLFGDVLITAFASIPSPGPVPYEQLTLAFSTVVPDAAGCILVLTGGLVLGAVRLHRCRSGPTTSNTGRRSLVGGYSLDLSAEFRDYVERGSWRACGSSPGSRRSPFAPPPLRTLNELGRWTPKPSLKS